jgi:hypothetical protein
VKLFRKPNTKVYWYDITVRGSRYRGSTQETKAGRALQVASLKLASVIGSADPLPMKPAVLREFADRFLDWVNISRLEEKNHGRAIARALPPKLVIFVNISSHRVVTLIFVHAPKMLAVGAIDTLLSKVRHCSSLPQTTAGRASAPHFAQP